MKLSAGLAFTTLLAYQRLAEAAGSSASLSARERILRRTEAGSSGHASYKSQQAGSRGQVRGTVRKTKEKTPKKPKETNETKKGNEPKGQKGKAKEDEGERGKAKDPKKGQKGQAKETKGEKGKAKEMKGGMKKKARTGNRAGPGGEGKKEVDRVSYIKEQHSGHMDADDSPIDLDSKDYVYGESISVNFKLTNDKIPTEVLKVLDVSREAEWTMGVFMRMADPQNGELQPIVSVAPSLRDAGAEEDRRLQDDATTETGTTVAPPAEVDAEDREPVNLNIVGSATITATDVDALPPKHYGTGFDVFLLDDLGRAIIGPSTFYMLPTQAMLDEEEEEKNAKPNHPLAKFDHSAKKKIKAQGKHVAPTSGKEDASGYGTGNNGGMIISTDESLADYLLVTDKEIYAIGEVVTVTYDLLPEGIDEARRNLQKTKADLFGDGEGGGYSNADDTTTAATSVATTAATEQPEPETDQGAPDEEDPDAGEDPNMVDPDDVTLFSMGLYMKMANPQRGDLPPIFSVPFCEVHDCTPKEVNRDEFQTGEITFNTAQINTEKYGSGYDVWILNGVGHGIAGPYYIQIDPSE